MRIYHLEPKAGAEANPNWRASTLPPTRAWVRAESEDDARRKLHLNTSIATDEPGLTSPWKDETLTDCYEDRNPAVAVPEGIIVTANGTITVERT